MTEDEYKKQLLEQLEEPFIKKFSKHYSWQTRRAVKVQSKAAV